MSLLNPKFIAANPRGGVAMGSSAPPSIHYGTVNGQVVRDIHDDGDFPDGTLHLALIYMGRYRDTP